MSGIAHLTKDNKTRASRIDSLGADGVNSIIERITGANPSPAKEGAEQVAQSSQVGAPPSPIMQNFMPQQQGGGELQQMQQRMQMLEQKVAHYESGTAAADKMVRQGKEDQTNRSGSNDSSGGTYAPNMNTKAAAKKITAKDKVDGEPDGVKARPGGQPMAAERMNLLGISMNEWNDLIGVTTPYANPVETQKNLSEAREGEEHEEFVESYFTEDELAEAWFGFISDKGYDPDEFADFAESAEQYGDEAALLAIQDLEDEFQEQVDACIEVDEARLNQEEVDFMMELWLEDRGLSTDMFHVMIDEAVATEDQDELDNLMAVEDLFYEYLDSVLEGESVHSVRMKLRGMGSRQVSPEELGVKRRGPVPDVTAKTRRQGADQKPKPGQGVMVGRNLKTAANEDADVKLPPMHPKSGGESKRFGGAASAFPKAKGSAKPKAGKSMKAKGKSTMPAKFHPRSTMEATAAEMQKELGRGAKSILTRDTKITPRTGGPQLPPHLLRKKGAEPTPAAKPTGIKAKLRAAFSRKKTEGRNGFPAWGIVESDSINFECDDDGNGPAIDWERLTKSYEKRGKGKR